MKVEGMDKSSNFELASRCKVSRLWSFKPIIGQKKLFWLKTPKPEYFGIQKPFHSYILAMGYTFCLVIIF